MSLNLEEVRRVMSEILCLDRRKMEDARLIERGSVSSWNTFRRDPYRWLLRLDKRSAERLERLIKESENAERSMPYASRQITSPRAVHGGNGMRPDGYTLS